MNFSVPPPFSPLPPQAPCVVPSGFSCIRWDATGQIITSGLGGAVFGVALAYCLKLLYNKNTLMKKKISFKIPETIKEADEEQH